MPTKLTKTQKQVYQLTSDNWTLLRGRSTLTDVVGNSNVFARVSVGVSVLPFVDVHWHSVRRRTTAVTGLLEAASRRMICPMAAHFNRGSEPDHAWIRKKEKTHRFWVFGFHLGKFQRPPPSPPLPVAPAPQVECLKDKRRLKMLICCQKCTIFWICIATAKTHIVHSKISTCADIKWEHVLKEKINHLANKLHIGRRWEHWFLGCD